MFRFPLLLVTLLATAPLWAQEPPSLLPPPNGTDVSDVTVEEMPEFPGGVEALAAFMKKEVKYPKKAKKAGIEGQVVVGFVVNKDGSVTDVTVVKGVDPLLDKEAMRAVRLMPKWRPGMMNGKPVKTKFNLPVRFKLKD